MKQILERISNPFHFAEFKRNKEALCYRIYQQFCQYLIKRKDSFELVKIMHEFTGFEPKM
ncbi:MAG: hypothetical protein IPM92_09695 [Saprospiraceae bacterium]|nr:hypothetical protein [Saprospiraceae bacterium]